jgi:hypothetical protein
MNKSYLELLAENDEEARKEFEPNAKELLTANFVEYEDHVDGHDAHPDEIEDQHEFQKPQGSHQLAGLMPEPAKDVHKSTTGVSYDKAVQVHVISIDSRFRSDQGDNPSNFLFKLLSPIKNVISIRLSSLEIPNTWYTFSKIRGNISMLLTIANSITAYGRVTITEGNYTANAIFPGTPVPPNDIFLELFNQLNGTLTVNSFSVFFDPISGKLTISCFKKLNAPAGGYTYLNQPRPMPTPPPSTLTGYETPMPFSINFADGIYSTRDDNWGLGYNLGFRSQQTPVATSHTASSIVDVIDSNYIFLSLNPDWRVVEHNQPDSSQTAAFAKVIVDVAKNDTVYDDGGNTITKQYYLKQPSNITSFNISVTDEYDQYIQLEGGNISMTLEVTEVLHSSLYESMRT